VAGATVVKVLLLEDDTATRDHLEHALVAAGHSVDICSNGNDAILLGLRNEYAVLIFDRMVPGVDGLSVLKTLRVAGVGSPAIFLTAIDGVHDRVEGLDAGADDFMAKPFEVRELEARIRALTRRRGERRTPSLHCGQLTYHGATRLFSIGELELKLTPRENALLEALIGKMERTVSKSSLADSLFSLADDASVDSIEVYVHRVRRKLAGSGAEIITLRGLGYLLRPSDAAS